MFSCKTMRTGVLVSLGLLVTGRLLELAAQTAVFATPLNYLAIAAVLSAVVLLAIVFILALIPAIARWLDGCQH